jgi:hypothetical protein
VPEFSPTIWEANNAGTSSRCNVSSDADPEVSPSLDAPATICHPFGVGKPEVEDLFLNRNLNLNRNLPVFRRRGSGDYDYD